MKTSIILFLAVILSACGGSLSDEQREALKKEKNARKIKRVTEDDIYEKVLQTGRSIMNDMNQGVVLSEVEDKYKAEILRVDDQTTGLETKEIEIWETYKSGDLDAIDGRDNVQKNGVDNFIYSIPVIGEKEDSVFLSGVWMIRMTRKEIVLSL